MVMTAAAMMGVKRQQSTIDGSVEGGRWTQAQQRVMTNNKKYVADDEGSNEEGGKKGDGNGDEGGGRATATMVQKRARTARAMVMRVVGDEEGDGNGGNIYEQQRQPRPHCRVLGLR